MIGTTAGNYRIVERIGDGGMGAVYRAVDEMLDREVAIKVLRPELARNAALIERFRMEAVALARLNHPRIAILHGLERHGESLLMIMEYVRGDTLEAIVQRSGRLAWSRAAELCAAVLDALDHAHDKGVVHRDIKPANVMLSSVGSVKVMDFGIARLVGKNRQTQAGHAVGTPMYMAPEQLRGEEVDGRTDLYAVGAVLFELVTGRMAFEAESDYALMMKQLHDPPPHVTDLVPDAPTALDEVIARAMAKSREARFPNAVAFRQALEALVGSTTAARRTPTPPTRLASDPPTPVPYASAAVVDPGATADHDTRSPAETRLAPSTPADASPVPPQEYHSPRVQPRQVAAAPEATSRSPVPPTVVAEVARVTASTTRPASGGLPEWARDWRSWASIAAVLLAVAISVQTLTSGPSLADEAAGGATTADSAAVVASIPSTTSPPGGNGIPAPGVSPAATSGGKTAEWAAGLTTAPGGSGTAPPSPTPRPTTPTESPAPPRAREVARNPARESAPRTTGTGGSASDGGSDATPPVRPANDPPPPAPPAAAREESTAEITSGVRSAIRDFAGAVSGGQVGQVQGALQADGETASQFISLVRERRLSMRLDGAPDVAPSGTRATATFDATLGVRSSFGAVKNRPARFAAELARGAKGWRVVSVRPLGALSLK